MLFKNRLGLLVRELVRLMGKAVELTDVSIHSNESVLNLLVTSMQASISMMYILCSMTRKSLRRSVTRQFGHVKARKYLPSWLPWQLDGKACFSQLTKPQSFWTNVKQRIGELPAGKRLLLVKLKPRGWERQARYQRMPFGMGSQASRTRFSIK